MDYRESHTDRGSDYDETLTTSPFDAYMARWEAIHVEKILCSRFPDGVDKYLDFACGTGRVTSLIAPHARVCVGVDISESMLDAAKRKLPTVRFVHADLTKEERDLGQFDLVSAFRFFGNAQAELRETVLGVLERLVAPGGYLLANNHRNPMALAHLILKAKGVEHEMDLTDSGFRTLLARFGFQLVLRKPIGVWKYRGKLMCEAHRDESSEKRLETTFGAQSFASIAPDTIYLFRRPIR